MPSSRPSPQLASRRRKIHHVPDSSEEEAEAFVPSKRHRKKRLRLRYSRARQVPTDQAFLSPVAIVLTPSSQTQTTPTIPTTDGKTASLHIPSPQCLPKQEEGVPSMAQHEPSPPEDTDSPPRTPFEFVWEGLVDEDFGSKVCLAYYSSQWREGFRVSKYGESIATEWKRGSTPEEAREAWRLTLEEQDRRMEASSTEEEEDEEDEQSGNRGNYGPKKPQVGIPENGGILPPPRQPSDSHQLAVAS
ncbi:MAG: hypothetical protein LQ343_008013 [Gyalolechia ehrenbergii]|nr:MAG: hypothetical protein LQ343_008013 [Gyalolechia ehrenbergii]